MNKQDLISHGAQAIGITKAKSGEAIEVIFARIAEAIVHGEEVAVAGFGKFLQKQRQATTARNPQTGEKINVPAKRVPQFKPHKTFATAVNQSQQGGS